MTTTNNIISMIDYKNSKEIGTYFARNQRVPLYLSHLTGIISLSKSPSKEHFGDKYVRIKSALERIENLMQALKQQ